MEKREPSYSVAKNVNWCSHYGEQYEKESCSVMSSSLGPLGILQARILELVAFPFSRGSSQPSQSVPRERTQVSCIAGGFFTGGATREAPENNKEDP